MCTRLGRRSDDTPRPANVRRTEWFASGEVAVLLAVLEAQLPRRHVGGAVSEHTATNTNKQPLTTTHTTHTAASKRHPPPRPTDQRQGGGVGVWRG